MSFLEAVTAFFRNYVNFETRASRSEYWWSYLFLALVNVFSLILFGMHMNTEAIIAVLLIGLALIVPTVALHARRLHDAGKSGLWIWAFLIPLVGPVLPYVLGFLPSVPANKWGEPPIPYVVPVPTYASWPKDHR